MSHTESKILGVSRRNFIKGAAGVSALALGSRFAHAAGSDETLKVGLIGCGGRGNGALNNFIEAANIMKKKVVVTGVCDVFEGRCKNAMGVAAKVSPITAEQCFVGFNSYKDLLKTDCDYVIIATSPNFRPLHFEAAVKAGKHVFMEKPVAVDPPGARKIIEAGELAKTKGLGVVAGTQRRHQAGYQKQAAAIQDGVVGEILGGTVSWCGGALWLQRQNPNEPDAEYMVRNWVSFTEMSGDHIVEQHVHNLDVANWFLGRLPKSALGFGGRARRETGTQFDFFSLDLDYGDGVHIHSMCRQIDGTQGGVNEFFRGTEGMIYGGGKIETAKTFTTPDFPDRNPYVQEHVNLVESVQAGKPLNEAYNVATSTAVAIMGRISAYTGEYVRLTDVLENEGSKWYNLALAPTALDFEKGPVTAPEDDVIAIPGRPKG